MYCPKCGYAMSNLEVSCPRCARMKALAPAPQTTAPPTTPAPTPPPRQAPYPQPTAPVGPWEVAVNHGMAWVKIAEWSGVGMKSTELFTVGPEWAIEWGTEPGKLRDMIFTIYTHDARGGLNGVDGNIIGAGHDTSYKHQAGTYYLKVNSGQRWKIIIWDKR